MEGGCPLHETKWNQWINIHFLPNLLGYPRVESASSYAKKKRKQKKGKEKEEEE